MTARRYIYIYIIYPLTCRARAGVRSDQVADDSVRGIVVPGDNDGLAWITWRERNYCTVIIIRKRYARCPVEYGRQKEKSERARANDRAKWAEQNNNRATRLNTPSRMTVDGRATTWRSLDRMRRIITQPLGGGGTWRIHGEYWSRRRYLWPRVVGVNRRTVWPFSFLFTYFYVIILLRLAIEAGA